ncbi:tetratricopeptide repeat protein [Streptomyces sp. NPDC055189]
MAGAQDAAAGSEGVENTITGGVFFHMVIQGRNITVQLPPQVTPALSGLPAASQTFTGRDEQLRHLLKALRPGGDRSCSAVAGLAGVGKTELVVQTAAQALRKPGWFPGGVLFADLSGYDSDRRVPPEQALDGWLRALGIPGEHIPPSLQDRQRLYRSVLSTYARHGRRLLVIIDNAAVAEQVSPLLPTDGATAALVTSRHFLDLDDVRLLDLDVLDDRASADLLDQAVRRARGSTDTRMADDPGAAMAIARLCAGLPLALRIAAAILAAAPTRPAASLASALDVEHSRLDKLSRPNRAVRAAFDLSYQLLDDGVAALFRLLPLNCGPDLSTEAAACLADGEPGEAEELLQHLAESHLVEFGHPWGRWRLHDLVRLFALDKGADRDSPTTRLGAQTRLFAYYVATTTAASTHLGKRLRPPSARFETRQAAMDWLDAELSNLIATVTSAPALGHPDTATSLAWDLARFLDSRRRYQDLITITSTALTVYRELGDRRREGMALNNLGHAFKGLRRFDEAIDAHTRDLGICRDLGDRRGEGIALAGLGHALSGARRFDEAMDAHTRELAICRELGDRQGESTALGSLGSTLCAMRRFEQSLVVLVDALNICRELGDRDRASVVLANLGEALRQVHRLNEAIDALTYHLAVCRELGSPHQEGSALNRLGNALQKARRFDEAIDAYTRSLAICRSLEDRYQEAEVLNNLGCTWSELRRFEEAAEAHTRAAAIFREFNDQLSEGTARNNLGNAFLETSRFSEAVDAYGRYLAICRELGDRHLEGQALNNLGNALREMNQFEEAIDAHTRDLTICRELGDLDREGVALNNLGSALSGADRLEEAVEAHSQAAALLHELGARHSEGMAWGNLGVALRRTGRLEEAIEADSRAVAVFRELDDWHREKMALMNLGLALQHMHLEKAATPNPTADFHFELTAGGQPESATELAFSLFVLAVAGVDTDTGQVLPGTLQAAEGAAELFRRQTAQDPALTRLYRDALQAQASVLVLLGRTWEAEEVNRRRINLHPPQE